MRNISHKNEFDLVVNMFTSFGYFDSRSENEKVIKSISDALRSGGLFYFDFLNSRYLQKYIAPFTTEVINNKAIIQLRRINNKMVEKTILIFDINGNGKNAAKPRVFTEKIRLFSDIEFKRIFRKFNLNIIKIFGDYNGSSFNKTKSERLIILAQKS